MGAINEFRAHLLVGRSYINKVVIVIGRNTFDMNNTSTTKLSADQELTKRGYNSLFQVSLDWPGTVMWIVARIQDIMGSTALQYDPNTL